MNADSFRDFETQALLDGFDTVLEREWAPLAELGPHTHPFAVKAVVTRGEMWLTVDDETRHLRPGDRFALEPDVVHSERYGPEGAAYWVARRNPVH